MGDAGAELTIDQLAQRTGMSARNIRAHQSQGMVAAELRSQLDKVATTCLRLFVDYVWKPFDQAGEHEKGMDKLLQAVERLRPLGSAAVGSLFQVAMSEALERRFGSELKRLEFQRSG